MTIEHKDIPDSGLHEPKGASTASAGEAYVADGTGSGSFQGPIALLPTITTEHERLALDDQGQIKSVKEGWYTIGDAVWDSGNKYPLLSGVDVVASFDSGNLSYSESQGIDIDYDYTTNTAAMEVGAMYLVNFRCKADGVVDKLLTIQFKSPSVVFNPLAAHTTHFGKGSDEFISFSAPIFVSADVAANGLQVSLLSENDNASMWDYSLVVAKLWSK